MQHTHMNRYEKIILGIKGAFWVAGLLMAGSDGQYMPWGNGIGVFLFAFSSFSLGKQSVAASLKIRAAQQTGLYRQADKRQKLSWFVPVTTL